MDTASQKKRRFVTDDATGLWQAGKYVVSVTETDRVRSLGPARRSTFKHHVVTVLHFWEQDFVKVLVFCKRKNSLVGDSNAFLHSLAVFRNPYD